MRAAKRGIRLLWKFSLEIVVTAQKYIRQCQREVFSSTAGIGHKKAASLTRFDVANGYNVSISARLHLNRRIRDCNFIPIYNFTIPGTDSADEFFTSTIFEPGERVYAYTRISNGCRSVSWQKYEFPPVIEQLLISTFASIVIFNWAMDIQKYK